MLTLEHELLAWMECYVVKVMSDPHQEFANRLNISRNEAKQKSYKIAWKVRTSDVIRAYDLEVL